MHKQGPPWKPAVLVVLAATLLLWGCAGGRKKYVAPPPPTPAAPLTPEASALERVIAEYYGAPYRSGGTTPAGVDCSGLVMGAYKRLGLSLPRTAAQQYFSGQPVPRSQLRFGDVVFFNRYCQYSKSGPYMAAMLPASYVSQVCHNGIYLGGGRFVHASSRGVEIGNLNDEIWRASFLGARRFLPGELP
jgi:cell wall-associated NlpC family hydrolase|uniref:NlpC/P60 family protein n=1 Tax=Desulfobacca acetoxidans TaxID=60893 RepID=A0A7V6A320_9BACT